MSFDWLRMSETDIVAASLGLRPHILMQLLGDAGAAINHSTAAGLSGSRASGSGPFHRWQATCWPGRTS